MSIIFYHDLAIFDKKSVFNDLMISLQGAKERHYNKEALIYLKKF